MKISKKHILTLIILCLIVSQMNIYSQEITQLELNPKPNIDVELKSKVEYLEQDRNIERVISIDVNAYSKGVAIQESNETKIKLFKAYFNKNLQNISAVSLAQVGIEGQYTKTFLTVNKGMAEMVYAYYGNHYGSPDLQIVKTYYLNKPKIGFYKNGTFIELKNIKKITELLSITFNNIEKQTLEVF